jgi:hypothetical protein
MNKQVLIHPDFSGTDPNKWYVIWYDGNAQWYAAKLVDHKNLARKIQRQAKRKQKTLKNLTNDNT